MFVCCVDPDQDVLIVESETIKTSVKTPPKYENDEKEKGSAIVVLDSAARVLQPREPRSSVPVNQRNLVG